MQKNEEILRFIQANPGLSSKEIHENIGMDISYATVKRMLSKFVSENLVQAEKRKYTLAPTYSLFHNIDMDDYFQKEIDERTIQKNFNFGLLDILRGNLNLFTEEESVRLEELQRTFRINISHLSETEYAKEMERLAIDLSWKSSQIEGNTYSLLETENLLREKETAEGKTKEEAIMLLNHKDALDFILQHPDYLSPLSTAKIEDIHRILVKELGVDRNIRTRKVGITGTNYTPLDNEFQIREALQTTCNIINKRENVFEKAFLALALLSYIQPFGDGNKRTARIVSNAILLANSYCPLSFRTVDSIDYKKAMLLFYEQNNLIALKKIYIEQVDFAVKTYF